MKINIYTFPFRGHVMQAVKLANYLSSKGHKITVDTHPNYYKYLNKEIITSETLYKFITHIENIDRFTLLNCAEGILLTSKNYLDDFEKNADKPDLIIFDSMAYWGKMIAEKHKIYSISLITIQPFTHKNFIDYAYQYLSTYSSKFKDSQSFLRSLHIFQEIAKSKYNLSNEFVYDDLLCATGDQNLVLMPKSFCKFFESLNVSFKGFSPLIDFKSKNINKEKSVYIATGSMINDIEFLTQCINILLNLKIKIHVGAGKFARELKQKFACFDNIYIYEFAPQLEILQNCSGFITHGGSNSICEAIYCKTPMVVIPFTNDEFLNAEMVTQCKIGLKLKNDSNEIAKNLKDYVEKLLKDRSFADNIEELSKEIDSSKILNIIDEVINKKITE